MQSGLCGPINFVEDFIGVIVGVNAIAANNDSFLLSVAGRDGVHDGLAAAIRVFINAKNAINHKIRMQKIQLSIVIPAGAIAASMAIAATTKAVTAPPPAGG